MRDSGDADRASRAAYAMAFLEDPVAAAAHLTAGVRALLEQPDAKPGGAPVAHWASDHADRAGGWFGRAWR